MGNDPRQAHGMSLGSLVYWGSYSSGHRAGGLSDLEPIGVAAIWPVTCYPHPTGAPCAGCSLGRDQLPLWGHLPEGLPSHSVKARPARQVPRLGKMLVTCFPVCPQGDGFLPSPLQVRPSALLSGPAHLCGSSARFKCWRLCMASVTAPWWVTRIRLKMLNPDTLQSWTDET